MANLLDYLQLFAATPRALYQRMQPNPAETMATQQQPGYEMGATGQPGQPWLKQVANATPAPAVGDAVVPDVGDAYSLGGMQQASALMPFLQGMAAKQQPAAARPHRPAVSSAIAARPQPAQSAAGAGFPSFISSAAAAEPTPAFYSEPASPQAPMATGTTPQSGIMAQLQGYLDRMNQPEDKSAALQDNLLALAIGGLNTAAAASRPGASALGSFAEGNAGGLNTMLALRNARGRESRDQSREALGVLGTMANLENSAATRADTAAYRNATLGSDAAQRAQREKESQANLALNRDKLAADQAQAAAALGIKRDELALDTPVRKSQAAENMARAKYYESGGAGGGPGGAQDPADVRAANWLISNKVASDPAMAWDMVRKAKDNPSDALTKIYTGLANDPMNMRKSPEELAGMAKQAYRSLFEAPSGGGGAAPQQGMPAGARQAKDGQWYVPDPNSKSGWSRVITTP